MYPLKKVSKEELAEFVKSYPNTLVWDVYHVPDPPVGSYNDFSLGNWPESIVATVNFDREGNKTDFFIYTS